MKRQIGIGAAFTLEVEAAIDRIFKAPLLYPVIEQDVRRCLTHAFPYGILYTIEDQSVLILAVMHLRRRPGYWRDRVSS